MIHSVFGCLFSGCVISHWSVGYLISSGSGGGSNNGAESFLRS